MYLLCQYNLKEFLLWDPLFFCLASIVSLVRTNCQQHTHTAFPVIAPRMATASQRSQRWQCCELIVGDYIRKHFSSVNGCPHQTYRNINHIYMDCAVRTTHHFRISPKTLHQPSNFIFSHCNFCNVPTMGSSR